MKVVQRWEGRTAWGLSVACVCSPFILVMSILGSLLTVVAAWQLENHTGRSTTHQYIRYQGGIIELSDTRIDPQEELSMADEARFRRQTGTRQFHCPVD